MKHAVGKAPTDPQMTGKPVLKKPSAVLMAIILLGVAPLVTAGSIDAADRTARTLYDVTALHGRVAYTAKPARKRESNEVPFVPGSLAVRVDLKTGRRTKLFDFTGHGLWIAEMAATGSRLFVRTYPSGESVPNPLPAGIYSLRVTDGQTQHLPWPASFGSDSQCRASTSLLGASRSGNAVFAHEEFCSNEREVTVLALSPLGKWREIARFRSPSAEPAAHGFLVDSYHPITLSGDHLVVEGTARVSGGQRRHLARIRRLDSPKTIRSIEIGRQDGRLARSVSVSPRGRLLVEQGEIIRNREYKSVRVYESIKSRRGRVIVPRRRKDVDACFAGERVATVERYGRDDWYLLTRTSKGTINSRRIVDRNSLADSYRLVGCTSDAVAVTGKIEMGDGVDSWTTGIFVGR